MHACMHACMHAYIHTYIHTYIHRTVPTENNKTQLTMHRPGERNLDNIHVCCNNSYLFLLLFGGEGDLKVEIKIL